jgi:hypothetical protein
MYRVSKSSTVLFQAVIFLLASLMAAATRKKGRESALETEPASIGSFDDNFKTLAASSGAGTLAYMAASAYNASQTRRFVIVVFVFAFVLFLMQTVLNHQK